MLILYKSICCDLLSEPSRCDGSDEESQLVETVHMRGHNIWFRREIRKNQLLPLI